jgi:hypothetical protein
MNTKECLVWELQSFRAEVVSRLDPQAGRCQTLLRETGRRWGYGIDTWAVKIEESWRPKTGRSPTWPGE